MAVTGAALARAATASASLGSGRARLPQQPDARGVQAERAAQPGGGRVLGPAVAEAVRELADGVVRAEVDLQNGAGRVGWVAASRAARMAVPLA